MLLGTDIRIAAEHATFNIAEVKRGILPGNGGTQRILDQLPYAIGMELLLTGDSIDAQKALHYGLINKVVPKEKLMETARDDARRRSPPTRRSPCRPPRKWRCARARWTAPPGLRFEAVINRLLQFTEDAKEGPAAFAEKRPPNFKGR